MKILYNKKKNLYTGGIRSGIAMEIYEKIRYYREHTDFSQRNVAKIAFVNKKLSHLANKK